MNNIQAIYGTAQGKTRKVQIVITRTEDLDELDTQLLLDLKERILRWVEDTNPRGAARSNGRRRTEVSR